MKRFFIQVLLFCFILQNAVFAQAATHMAMMDWAGQAAVDDSHHAGMHEGHMNHQQQKNDSDTSHQVQCQLMCQFACQGISLLPAKLLDVHEASVIVPVVGPDTKITGYVFPLLRPPAYS